MLLQRMLLQWGGKGGGGRGSINKREIGALGGSRCIAIIDSGGGIRDFSCRLLPKCSSSTKRLSSDVLKRSSAFFSYISILVKVVVGSQVMASLGFRFGGWSLLWYPHASLSIVCDGGQSRKNDDG